MNTACKAVIVKKKEIESYDKRVERREAHKKSARGIREVLKQVSIYGIKTEHKLNQAKLEGEARNRSEAWENLFAEATISCRPLSDLKVAQGFSKPITVSIVKLHQNHNGLLSTLK